MKILMGGGNPLTELLIHNKVSSYQKGSYYFCYLSLRITNMSHHIKHNRMISMIVVMTGIYVLQDTRCPIG